MTLVDGERVFGDYDEGVLEQYTLSSEDMDFISTHDVVVCDLWGKVGRFFGQLQQRGVKTAFDCATRPGDAACAEAIPYTDYLFFSSDDGDTETLRELMKVLHRQGPKLVIAMLGEQGSLCFDGQTFHSFGIVPCPNVVDTMGAGDSYIAGFLHKPNKKGLDMEHIGTGLVSLQLREIIRAQIEEGIYPPGTAIPPENELAAQYDVNRLTVRTAIGALVYEGLLKRVQGKGVYVLGEKLNRDLDHPNPHQGATPGGKQVCVGLRDSAGGLHLLHQAYLLCER